MRGRSTICGFLVTATLTMPMAAVQAFDESKYPDMQGQWARAPGNRTWDPTKGRVVRNNPH
jgi:hypothetical protein